MGPSAGSAMTTFLMKHSRSRPYCIVEKAAMGKVLEFKLL